MSDCRLPVRHLVADKTHKLLSCSSRKHDGETISTILPVQAQEGCK